MRAIVKKVIGRQANDKVDITTRIYSHDAPPTWASSVSAAHP
jgi:hypothetical protein